MFLILDLKLQKINLVNKEKMLGHEINIPNMAKSFQDVAIKEIMDRVVRATTLYKVKEIVLAGGVSANSYLRSKIKEKFNDSDIKVVIPPLWATTDNAAMICKVGEYLHKKGLFTDLNIGVDSSWKIEDDNKF